MQKCKIFLAYPREDEMLKDELIKHLASLKRQGKITEWHDRKIIAGEDWDKKIHSELSSSDIILLLISPAFIASDYCFNIELQKALELRDEGKAVVVPIILKPCDWTELPFGKLHALPKNTKPIVEWDNQDRAFVDVINELKKIIEILNNNENDIAVKEHTKQPRLIEQKIIEHPKTNIPRVSVNHEQPTTNINNFFITITPPKKEVENTKKSNAIPNNEAGVLEPTQQGLTKEQQFWFTVSIILLIVWIAYLIIPKTS